MTTSGITFPLFDFMDIRSPQALSSRRRRRGFIDDRDAPNLDASEAPPNPPEFPDVSPIAGIVLERVNARDPQVDDPDFQTALKDLKQAFFLSTASLTWTASQLRVDRSRNSAHGSTTPTTAGPSGSPTDLPDWTQPSFTRRLTPDCPLLLLLSLGGCTETFVLEDGQPVSRWVCVEHAVHPPKKVGCYYCASEDAFETTVLKDGQPVSLVPVLQHLHLMQGTVP